MEELVRCSYRNSFAKELESTGGTEMLCSQELDECGTESVVRLTVINPQFEQPLARAVDKLIGAGLRVDKFGFANASGSIEPPTSSEEPDVGSKMLSDKLTVLVNDIAIAMNRLGYASYRGKVYKKDSRSKYSYSYKCEARAFVNTLATNEFFKSRLIREIKKVSDLLADPYCELFAPLTVDYDLIEVNNGWCWSIKRRDFVNGAIQDHQIGKVSPRAFCPFDATRDPDPKYFKEVLENSLEPQEVAKFCDDFLKLLSYNKKRHKDKVPCLVGDANSGKTSLFFPILGLIHHGNVATVTKQRAFNKSMITPFTEVIFIDEATETTLDIDDWKILTQGGYAAHDVKYQSARAFINRCPMLITSQQKLKFGPADQAAMDRRLRTYSFRSLSQPKKKASTWMKKHAMDCVVWAAQKAKASKDDEESESGSDTSAAEDESQAAEGVLLEEEKGEIRSLSLPALLTKEAPAGDTTDEELADDAHGHESNSLVPADRVQLLQGFIEQQQPGSLRHRHLEQMLRMEERRLTEEQRSREERIKQRKNLLRAKGVSSQNLSLLPDDPDEPVPSPVAKDLQRFNDAQAAAQKELRRERARKAYEGDWLRSTEKELHDCAKSIFTCVDPEMQKSLTAYREVLEDKLKNHHRNLGTLGCCEALQERKRVCVSLGVIRNSHQHLVKSVFAALPTPEELGESSVSATQHEEGCAQEDPGDHTTGDQNCSTGEAVDDDDERIFITPVPSWHTSHTEFERTRKATPGKASSQTRGKRPRSNSVQSKTAKRPCNHSITKYFSSQQ